MAAHRSCGAVRRLAAAILVAGLFLGVSAGSASARTASWQLEDYQQRACFSERVHDVYYGVYVEGRWRTPIHVGASGLPAGARYEASRTIPPGSSSGEYSLAYVKVTLPANFAQGRYVASLWADAGAGRASVPIRMVVKESCGY